MASVMLRPDVAASNGVMRDGGRLVVQTWLFTRLLLVGVALWVGITTGRSAGDMLANWDVQHYFDIARYGYVADNDIAFFPGWPLVLRAFWLVGVPMLWAGVGVAVICSGFAAAALHRLGGPVAAVVWLLAPTTVFTFVPYTEAPFCAAAFWAWERAKAGRWGAAATLAAIACTLRVSGLFLLGALVILALTEAGRTRVHAHPAAVPHARQPWRWPWQRVPQQSSSAGRPALRWPWARRQPSWPAQPEPRQASSWPAQPAQQHASTWPGRRAAAGSIWAAARTGARRLAADARVRALAWLTIPALALFAYISYLYNLTGDWNAWYRAQSTGWPRGFTWPWVSLQHTIEAATSTAYPAFPEWSWVFRAEIASMVLGIVVTVVCLSRRRWGEAFWVGIQVLAFSCSYWFLSVNRAVLLWFPLFILIGEALSGGWNVRPGRRRVRILLTIAAFVGAGLVLCFWAWLFFTGRWAS